MAIVQTAPTITTAEILDGTIVNADVAAAAAIVATKFAAVPACRVYHNAAQSIANATPTTLAFNSERFDTDTMHDTVTNNDRITAMTAGVYLISVAISYASAPLGLRETGIILNGATNLADDTKVAISGSAITTTVSTVYALAAGHYVTVEVYQTSTAALDVSAIGNFTPEFMAIRLSA